MNIFLKRIYEPSSKNDGVRLLVERLWPRGMSKQSANVDYWLKDLAPTTELRKWYDHRRERWEDFRRHYLAELANTDPLEMERLLCLCYETNVTFLFAARDEERNSAIVLRDFVHKCSKK